MKTLKNLYLIIMILPLLAGNCNKDFFNGYDMRFKVKNISNNSIYVTLNNKYPDTVKFVYTPLTVNKEYKTNHNETATMHLTGSSWEREFAETPQNIISLFIFSSDSLEKLPFDTIIAKYIILQRYDLTLQNMKDRNWEIEYPYDSTRGKLKVYKR